MGKREGKSERKREWTQLIGIKFHSRTCLALSAYRVDSSLATNLLQLQLQLQTRNRNEAQVSITLQGLFILCLLWRTLDIWTIVVIN